MQSEWQTYSDVCIPEYIPSQLGEIIQQRHDDTHRIGPEGGKTSQDRLIQMRAQLLLSHMTQRRVLNLCGSCRQEQPKGLSSQCSVSRSG